MTEQEKYLEGHRNCGIKVGDRVRVTRKAESCEDGWDNIWVYEMNSSIGVVGTVYLDNHQMGYTLEFDIEAPCYLDFPYFILEKI